MNALGLQYKAVETLFRQELQAKFVAAIADPSGIFQRKLDLIGYGRGGRTRVEAFEAYLAGLPIVRDIPQFSGYKLSRLLTAVAMYHLADRRLECGAGL